jgi:hypothetical protein
MADQNSEGSRSAEPAGRLISFWLNNVEIDKLEAYAKRRNMRRNTAIREIIRDHA